MPECRRLPLPSVRQLALLVPPVPSWLVVLMYLEPVVLEYLEPVVLESSG